MGILQNGTAYLYYGCPFNVQGLISEANKSRPQGSNYNQIIEGDLVTDTSQGSGLLKRNLLPTRASRYLDERGVLTSQGAQYLIDPAFRGEEKRKGTTRVEHSHLLDIASQSLRDTWKDGVCIPSASLCGGE